MKYFWNTEFRLSQGMKKQPEEHRKRCGISCLENEEENEKTFTKEMEMKKWLEIKESRETKFPRLNVHQDRSASS